MNPKNGKLTLKRWVTNLFNKRKEESKEDTMDTSAVGYESGGQYPLQQEQMSSNN